MSSGSKPGKQTTESTPWAEAIPYLIGDASKGIPGLFPEAKEVYEKGQWTPAMQDAQNWYQGLAGDRIAGAQQTANLGTAAMGGAFNSEGGEVNPLTVERVDPVAARGAQGTLDPTAALSRLLSGQVNTEQLDPLAASITEQVRRNTMENVMPGIRSESVAAGQYGGSAQGVAEGLAASRAQQDLATGLAPVYAGAFENAQNRQLATAGALNQQAESIATGNAGRQLQGDQFNRDLELRKQQLEIQRNAANLAAMMQGTNIYGQGLNFQDIGLSQYTNSLQAPTDYARESLGSYASIISPGAGMGGTSKGTVQSPRNPLMQTAGAAAAGFAMGGPVGAGIGGILGLLGSLS